MKQQTIIKGLKFLSPDLATYYNGERTDYAPALTGWMSHPGPGWPGKADGADCGPGGYHIMLICSAVYAPTNWRPWRAIGKGILGKSNEKARVTSIRLRAIPPKLWWRYLRRFGRNADLSNADLSNANLRNADLSCADLSCADLRNADLSCADLRYANLRYANLSCADLRYANLSCADLRYANLRYANLSCTNLRNADLGHAIACKLTVWPDGLDPTKAGVFTIND